MVPGKDFTVMVKYKATTTPQLNMWLFHLDPEFSWETPAKTWNTADGPGGSGDFVRIADGDWTIVAWHFQTLSGKTDLFVSMRVTDQQGANQINVEVDTISVFEGLVVLDSPDDMTTDPAAPTATPTVEPTATPTVEPTATPTVEPTATPTGEPTSEPTATPTTSESESNPSTGDMNLFVLFGFLSITCLMFVSVKNTRRQE
jgi:hypothetical protein